MAPSDEQLPAIIEPPITLPTVPADTYIVPALITDARRRQAGWRYVEFFAANINNDHTRRAYARACSRFFAWCEQRGLTLSGNPAVRRRRMGQTIAGGTWGAGGEAAAGGGAHAVRLAGDRPDSADESGRGGARTQAHRQDRQDAGARGRPNGGSCSTAFRPSTLRDLRDRALIATLTYSFARITAALKMKVEDLRPRGPGWTIRLHEKGGKEHVMPCHHALAEALHAYIAAAGIGEDRKGWLFRTAPRHNANALTDHPMNQYAAWLMIRRRAAAAGITAPKSATIHFARPGITAYLANGGALEHAQEMAAHESPRTTKLYDRTKERLTQDEVERIRL